MHRRAARRRVDVAPVRPELHLCARRWAAGRVAHLALEREPRVELHHVRALLAREVDEAMQDIETLADEGLTWRLSQAAEARHRAEHGQTEDKTEYDIGPNGARIKREERSAFESLLDQIEYGKPRSGGTPDGRVRKP